MALMIQILKRCSHPTVLYHLSIKTIQHPEAKKASNPMGFTVMNVMFRGYEPTNRWWKNTHKYIYIYAYPWTPMKSSILSHDSPRLRKILQEGHQHQAVQPQRCAWAAESHQGWWAATICSRRHGGVDSCGMSWMIFRLNTKTGGMCLAAAS